MSESGSDIAATYDSRAALFLAHLGDGLILGAVPYFGISFILFLFSGFFARIVSDHPGLVGILVVFLVVVGSRYTVAAILREGTYGRKIDGWKEKRRLSWVGAIGILTTLVLLGVTISLGGWQLLSTLILPYFFAIPVLVVGLIMRVISEHVMGP